MPAKSLKAADKQTILKKLVTEMKRRYGGSVPKQTRPAFETLLFAACLEDASQSDAEAAYARLLDGFFDLNEIRVSSVRQIEETLGDLHNADWKALRIREALQHVFEKFYAFDLEFLRRKTQEQALKELSLIPYLTPFMRSYVVQHVLGAHVLPIDRYMDETLIWLGLTEAGGDGETAAEDLKSGVKKADGVLLCHLLKCVSSDPELREHFAEFDTDETPIDPFTAPQRLAELFKNPQKKKKPKAKAPAAKATTTKAAKAKQSSSKSAGSKSTGSKTGGSKSVKSKTVKTVSRKKPSKKVPERSAASGKTKSSTARKVTKKVPVAKKTTRKRSK